MKKKGTKCCNYPDHVVAYAKCWPFKVKYCRHCKAAHSDTNWFLDLILIYFIVPFWNGLVFIPINPQLYVKHSRRLFFKRLAYIALGIELLILLMR